MREIFSCAAPGRVKPAALPRLRPVAVAAGLVWSGATWAQAPSTVAAPTVLPAVTVSASGLQLGQGDMVTPVSVLEGDALLRRREATLGETLADEPGIRSSHFGAGAGRPIVRGMDGPRVKLLNDGVEIQDVSTISPDHAVVAEPLLASQIEVLRGPSALLYGAGAVGGVVNVLDNKVPTAMPEKGVEGSAELRANTGARENAGAFELTGGTGNLVLHVGAATRKGQDYRVGKGWTHEGLPERKVPGSFAQGDTGTLGLSWVGDRGYLGLAYTRQTARYGLPGHGHALEDCHAHGNRLHCGTHEPTAATGTAEVGHDHEASHQGLPVVDLLSERWDLRGELRNPLPGITAVRLRAGTTDYRHHEIEDGAISTTFLNKAHDARLELQHLPIAGWRGVFGIQAGQRQFSALGNEAYVPPTDTRRTGLFWLEDYRWQDWRLEAALRHDRQTVEARTLASERSHHGSSLSLGTVWKFMPGYQLGTSLSRTYRLPSAEELYANGLHLATGTVERGNANLRPEISQNLDVTLRKTAGDTTFAVSAFRNHIQRYIYGRTLDALDGIQLIEYSQADATFTGLEGQWRHRLNRSLGVTVFGDVVRATLDGGGPVPRIPAARAGVRLDARWQAWDGMVEWVQVLRQNRIAAFESETAGYGMLNLALGYQFTTGRTPWQFYVKAHNLTDRLGYAHQSFIKTSAPLMGRNLTAGVRVSF